MVAAEAASVKIVDAPCLPVARLRDLRMFLDSVLACFPSGEISGGGADAEGWASRQQDLFEEEPPVLKLEATERREVVTQLQALLSEAMVTTEDQQEAGDDKDHA